MIQEEGLCKHAILHRWDLLEGSKASLLLLSHFPKSGLDLCCLFYLCFEGPTQDLGNRARFLSLPEESSIYISQSNNKLT